MSSRAAHQALTPGRLVLLRQPGSGLTELAAVVGAPGACLCFSSGLVSCVMCMCLHCPSHHQPPPNRHQPNPTESTDSKNQTWPKSSLHPPTPLAAAPKSASRPAAASAAASAVAATAPAAAAAVAAGRPVRIGGSGFWPSTSAGPRTRRPPLTAEKWLRRRPRWVSLGDCLLPRVKMHGFQH